MPRPDGITWAWLTPGEFPKPCDFCGEPIHKEHAYRVEIGRASVFSEHPATRLKCERCLTQDPMVPLRIRWGVTRDIYTNDGNIDTWEPLCKDQVTLEDAYALALQQSGRFSIIKWYILNNGRHGSPCFKGWASNLEPLPILLAKAEGTYARPLPEMRHCVKCGKDTMILCRTCGQPVCWDHRTGGWLDHHIPEQSSNQLPG